MYNMNSLIKKGITSLLTLILFSSIFTITSCSFEDDIVLEPGNFVFYNNSDIHYDLTIINTDSENQTIVSESILKGNSQVSIPLQKGYSYEATAVEIVSGEGDIYIYTKVFIIGAHQDTEWCIPNE